MNKWTRWLKINAGILDVIALTIGIAAIAWGIKSGGDYPNSNMYITLNKAACIIGWGYVVYAAILWFLMRPKFDWHLTNGHFLRKVCCLVLLAPSMLTSIVVHHIDSPKQMVYEENLYHTKECKRDSICGIISSYQKDSLSEQSVTLYTLVDEKLPDSVAKKQTDPSPYWTVYYHFIDPGNQHMVTTEKGRQWAALISILGVFLLNGLLVSSIIGYIDSRKEKWQKGEVRYKWFMRFRWHYVIIGGNDVVSGIVKHLLKKIEEDKCFFTRFIKPYILIQTSRNIEDFRRKLFSELTDKEQRRIIIYYGNRNSTVDIKDLRLENAKEVYVIGEDVRTDDLESYHDTMNMECLDMITDYYKNTYQGKQITGLKLKIEEIEKLKEQKKNTNEEDKKEELERDLDILKKQWERRVQLKCRVMFEYQTTFSVFQFYDINQEVNAYLKFKPFNNNELWAQKVLINKEIDPEKLKANAAQGTYLPLEGADGIKMNDNTHVHLFIIGMSRMGVAMGIEAAHLAHYPNYETKGIRTKITFIDKNATEEKDFFMGRFKALFKLSHWRYANIDNDNLVWKKTHVPFDLEYLGGDFLDIEWEFINGGIEHGSIQDYILASATPSVKITIAICLPESNQSHAAALYLDKRIYDSNSVIQILAYNRYGSSIINAITQSGNKHPYCAKLKSFGKPSDLFVDNDIEQSENIGRKINDIYNKISVTEQYHPLKAPGNYKGKSIVANNWSSIYNGNMLWTKLRCAGYSPQDEELTEETINTLADVEHNRWNVEELLMNFRPLTKKEQSIEQSKGNENKNILKGMMAHTDICSNKKLLEIDLDARQYDIELTRCLPEIYDNLNKPLE